jgi:hypothetical protein
VEEGIVAFIELSVDSSLNVKLTNPIITKLIIGIKNANNR